MRTHAVASRRLRRTGACACPLVESGAPKGWSGHSRDGRCGKAAVVPRFKFSLWLPYFTEQPQALVLGVVTGLPSDRAFRASSTSLIRLPPVGDSPSPSPSGEVSTGA